MIPGTWRSSTSPGSARSWRRCSSPRSVTCTGSPGPAQLTCWAGLTPKHHESDTTVHRGRITKQGSRLVRWAAIESVQILPETSHIGGSGNGSRIAAARNIGVVAAARKQLELVFYGLRDHQVRALHRHRARHEHTGSRSARIVQVMTPEPGVVAPSD